MATKRARRAPGGTADRRQQILDVSAELFAERGYASTTVRNIAERTGLLSGSLYHHFDSKDAILDEILTEFVDELIRRDEAVLAESGDDPRRALEGLISVTLNAIADHRPAILLLQNDWPVLRDVPRFKHLSDKGAIIDRMWTSVLEEGRQRKVFRDDLALDLVWRFVRDALWVAARWYEPGRRYTLDDIADEYSKLIFRGLLQK